MWTLIYPSPEPYEQVCSRFWGCIDEILTSWINEDSSDEIRMLLVNEQATWQSYLCTCFKETNLICSPRNPCYCLECLRDVIGHEQTAKIGQTVGVHPGFGVFCGWWNRMLHKHQDFCQTLHQNFNVILNPSRTTGILRSVPCQSDSAWEKYLPCPQPQTLQDLKQYQSLFESECDTPWDARHVNKLIALYRHKILIEMKHQWYAGFLLSVKKNNLECVQDVLEIIMGHFIRSASTPQSSSQEVERSTCPPCWGYHRRLSKIGHRSYANGIVLLG